MSSVFSLFIGSSNLLLFLLTDFRARQAFDRNKDGLKFKSSGWSDPLQRPSDCRYSEIHEEKRLFSHKLISDLILCH